jgi:DNA (cytosine-5)-methyltransferase 1
MRVVWQCESDEYCRRVLARHWPGVPCHPDVRDLVADRQRQRQLQPQGIEPAQWRRARDRCVEADCLPVPVPYVDVLAGGFPCQDLSVAGKGAGIDGARSGLWSEFARLIGELRPRYVLVENVPALLTRGFERVLADLAACGYDAEWDCLPASAFGAPHRRDRIWLVAYDQGDGRGPGRQGRSDPGRARQQQPALQGVADAERSGLQRRTRSGIEGERWPPSLAARIGEGFGGQWEPEPDVGRVAHGVPARVDRLRSLGNSLVPQIAEWIGWRIVAYEEGRLAA